MAAATEQTASLLPPRTETGWIAWARLNLFGSLPSSIVTVVSVPLVLWACWSLLSWIFTEADWTLVTSRPQLYIIGTYPTEHVWRPLVGLLMVSVLFGMAAGMWKGAAQRISIGYGAIVLLAGILPYGALHEGVEMPLDVRLLVLGNLPVLAAGYWLGTTGTVGQPRWLVVGGLVTYFLFLLLLLGLPGVKGLEPVSPTVWEGLMLNLILSVSGIVLSFPIGVALALGRRSNLPVVKLLCVVFIEVFRGVPLITLLFVSRHLVPLALPEDFPVNPLTRAAITITLFSAAYMAENIRGGLQGLPPGQAEAARALGLPGWRVTTLILLPQAIRNVIPAIVGQFIGLFKDTSLISIIGMVDILEMGRSIVGGHLEFSDNPHELYLFVAVVFWLFAYTMSYASRNLERHLGVGER